MKTLKKVLALVLAAMFVVTCFAGCGAKDVIKIGVQQDTTGDIYATDEFGEDHVVRFKTGNDAVQALVTGKVSAVIIDNEPAKSYVASNAGLKILDTPYAEEEYAICVSKENTELLENINTALAELKADGTVQGIVDKYISGKEFDAADATTVPKTNGTLIMATNASFPPYEYMDGGKVVGIDAEIAAKIADKLGMELKIEDTEFGSIIGGVVSGKYDMGMAGMTVTEERQQSVNFSDTYALGVQSIIVTEGSTITSIDDLSAAISGQN